MYDFENERLRSYPRFCLFAVLSTYATMVLIGICMHFASYNGLEQLIYNILGSVTLGTIVAIPVLIVLCTIGYIGWLGVLTVKFPIWGFAFVLALLADVTVLLGFRFSASMLIFRDAENWQTFSKLAAATAICGSIGATIALRLYRV